MFTKKDVIHQAAVNEPKTPLVMYTWYISVSKIVFQWRSIQNMGKVVICKFNLINCMNSDKATIITVHISVYSNEIIEKGRWLLAH